MSEVLMSGGAGGIDSSDVTAAKSDVLEGKSTITSDSNDEVVQGTMPLLTSNSDLLNVMLAYQRTDQLGMGKFIDSPSLGRGLMVALRPEDSKKYAIDNRTAFVFIPLSDLKAENIRADKNIAQVQGSIPVVGKTGIAQGGVFLANGYVFFHNIPVGIYESQGESWAPEAAAPIEKVRAGLGIQAHKIAGDETIAGLQGGIPVWDAVKSGYSDMIYAWGDEGHYVDHPVAGRGVISKIGNNHIIRNANWVFLAEHDLVGSNIRAGVNMFGVQGEMVDYGAGGVPFNGATFDNRLMSGVADKGKEIVMSGVWATGNMSFSSNQSFTNWNVWSYKFMGIRDGGIRFSVSDRNRQGVGKASIATFFDRSINLTPFRKVKVGAKFLSGNYKKSSTQNDRATATLGVVFVNKNNLTLSNNSQYKYQTILNASYKGKHISFQDGAEQEEVHEHGRLTGRQLWAEVDVSDINEHCFAFAYARADAGNYYAEAEMIINHIEFIN